MEADLFLSEPSGKSRKSRSAGEHEKEKTPSRISDPRQTAKMPVERLGGARPTREPRTPPRGSKPR